MRRLAAFTILALATMLLPAPAAVGGSGFPDTVSVPTGSFPEGVTIGRGHQLYVGSLRDGQLYRADLRTGTGEIIAEGQPGRITAGLYHDPRSNLVWAAGLDGGAGAVIAFDGATGEDVAVVPVPDGAFLNDLVVTRRAVHITDSLAEVFWTIPLDHRGLPAGPAEATQLTGDFTFVTEGDLPVNLNGIRATPDGRTLVAVHSTEGTLYRIDAETGEADLIELGAPMPSGDGLVLVGHTLYVVQNFINQIAVVRLSPGFTSGRIVDTLTDPRFDVPTTAARFGPWLYAVNARFDDVFPPFLGGDPSAQLDYDVVQVRRH